VKFFIFFVIIRKNEMLVCYFEPNPFILGGSNRRNPTGIKI